MKDYSHGAHTYCPFLDKTMGVCVNYTDNIITSYDCDYEACDDTLCQLKLEYPIGKKADTKFNHHSD